MSRRASMSSRFFVNELDDFGQRSNVALDRTRLLSSLQRTLHLVLQHVDPRKPSVYTGSCGVAYALWHIMRSPDAKDVLASGSLQSANGGDRAAVEIAQRAVDFLEHHPTAYPWSLLFGEGGAYVVAALCASHQGDQRGGVEALRFVDAYVHLARRVLVQCREDELLYGKAGYLLGCLLLNKHVAKDAIPESVLQDISASILNSGIMQARKLSGSPPLWWEFHDAPYVGAAHGFMGILYVLMHIPPGALEVAVPDAQGLIQKTLRYILNLECDADGLKPANGKGGHFPTRASYPNVGPEGSSLLGRSRCSLVHWCHGAPGAIFMFCRAYSVYSDRLYIEAALRAGEVVWEQGLLKKGPGACHGIAGNAYALLELYNLTRDGKWLHRAVQFASFMDSAQFRQGSHIPDHPYSLFEGWAAATCLYADLLSAEQQIDAAFPLFGSALLV